VSVLYAHTLLRRHSSDMDLHLCLPYLAKTGMGRGKTVEELETERPLVAGARVWLAVSSPLTLILPRS
jgi:hypothetical protein